MSAFSLSEAALASAEERGVPIALWWRDDDVRRRTPALERLLALQAHFRVPLALAAIPERLDPSLGRALPEGVSVLLHGHAHTNHAPDGAKRAEFGDDRPVEAMLAEIDAGRRALLTTFGARFRPVFVPPWNRIGTALAGRLTEAGIAGLSTHARHRAGSLRQINTHLDVMDWHPIHGLGLGELDARLAAEINRRLAGSASPVGLLTHHLQHDEAAWRGLETLLAFVAGRPALRWPGIDALFSPVPGER